MSIYLLRVTMRIWHWKSHWKVQPYWKPLKPHCKAFTKDNQTESFSFITLKSVCYCYPRMLIPYNQSHWQFSALLIPLFSQFSAFLWFFSVTFSVICSRGEWPWSFSSFTFHFNLYLSIISIDHMATILI